MSGQLILIGAGGHAQACLDVIEAGGQWDLFGWIAPDKTPGQEHWGAPVLGGDEALKDHAEPGRAALVALGHMGDSALRRKLFDLALSLGFDLPVIAAPSAHLSPRAQLGRGTIAMHQVTIQAGALVGENCILNDHALVEHSAQIGDDVHLSTGALVNGEAQVGAGAFIGSGAVIKEGVKLSAGVVIGAGAVVLKDLSEPGVYVGNPAKRIR